MGKHNDGDYRICTIVGNNIKKRRKGKGLTQIELGQLSGVNFAKIGRIERSGNPCLEDLEAIASALLCEVEDFLKVR